MPMPEDAMFTIPRMDREEWNAMALHYGLEVCCSFHADHIEGLFITFRPCALFKMQSDVTRSHKVNVLDIAIYYRLCLCSNLTLRASSAYPSLSGEEAKKQLINSNWVCCIAGVNRRYVASQSREGVFLLGWKCKRVQEDGRYLQFARTP